MAENMNLKRHMSNLVTIYTDNDSRFIHWVQMNKHIHVAI